MKIHFEKLVVNSFMALGLIVCVGLISWAGYTAYKVSTASGYVNFCYIAQTEGGHALYGNIEWDADKRMGVFGSFDEAAAAAQKINCPLDERGDEGE